MATAKSTSKEKINIATFDIYCEKNTIQRVDFIKVDVEGHELAVFSGMKRMLSEKQVQLIQFEYGGCNLDARVHLVDIWEYLAEFGFQFYKIFPDGLKAIHSYNTRLEIFKYSNWVAALPDAELPVIGDN